MPKLGRILGAGTAVVLLVTLYLLSPLVAAWQLREAIKSEQIAAIERKVQWPTVRESLRRSLATHAQLLPVATAAGAEVPPTLWQRIKGVFGATMLDRFIESYVTPAGLPKLFHYHRTWRTKIEGPADEPDAGSWSMRVQAVLRRMKRAEFESLGRFVIEIESPESSERVYRSVFELIGFAWILTELEILAAPPLTPAALPGPTRS